MVLVYRDHPVLFLLNCTTACRVNGRDRIFTTTHELR